MLLEASEAKPNRLPVITTARTMTKTDKAKLMAMKISWALAQLRKVLFFALSPKPQTKSMTI